MDRLLLTLAIEMIWGIVWATLLSRTKLGRYLAIEQTWITVVVGVGVTGLIGALVLDWQTVLTCTLLFVASSIGIIASALHQKADQWYEQWTEHKRDGSEP
jgi:Kef-type K+ transport system membrane component KefB